MTGFIESSVTLDEIARALKTTAAAVEAEADQLDLFIGRDWANRPALSTIDAAGIVSGTARREQSHDAAWRAHTAAVEAHEADREAVRVSAFRTSYDSEMRRGLGNSASAQSGHDAARAALYDFDASHRPPTFEGSSASPASWIKARVNKVKAAI